MVSRRFKPLMLPMFILANYLSRKRIIYVTHMYPAPSSESETVNFLLCTIGFVPLPPNCG